MKYRITILLTIFTLLLSACGSTSTVKQSLNTPSGNLSKYHYQIVDISSSAQNVPEEFIDNLRKYLEKDLEKKGILGTDKSAKNVKVNITDFKMPGRGSRLVFGMLAGKDFVKSTVSVTESGSGKTLGVTEIESSDRLNSGGPELFTSNHAKAISKFLLGKN